MSARITYLDNAATSFPKPPSVSREVKRCLDSYCGNAGRGAHSLSLAAANKVYECREEICTLIGSSAPESIAFVPTCTYGINLILKGILKAGDHVLISDAEHNCVLRPLERLRRRGIITYDTFRALADPEGSERATLNDIRSKLKKNTRLLVCTHQSNICSYSLPLQKIGALCKKNGILFAVDAAQSIGHYNIDIPSMNIDMLSAPGHKGLYGPQGSAFVAIDPSVMLDTLVEGGNGIYSLSPDMPDFLPERYEVGTLPLPCIAGLCEGIRELKRIGINTVREHEEALFERFRDGILNIKGATVYAPSHRGSTLLFDLDCAPPERVAQALDERGFCLRAGFHCSALAHRSLGTEARGGVRASFGIYNTERDVDRLLAALLAIQKETTEA